MKEGDVVLTAIPQADGQVKNRPTIVLREMPPYDDLLVCGISTQIHQQVQGFDETISPVDDDFAQSGLVSQSLIRLGFLAVLARNNVIGAIGNIAPERHQRLLQRLCDHLTKS
ncbi:MAG TPA: type II toxin-antitoxin system PemK/MazF family toxin [Chloroflexia bacterium]|jgi:mRNA interferase MazF